MSNIIDKLMEKDLDTLKEVSKKDLEITRLSEVFNEPFTVTVKEISYKRIADLRMLATEDGNADESQFLQFVVTEGIVSPDFGAKELLQKFQVPSKQALFTKLFKAGELELIAREVLALSGYGDKAIKKVIYSDGDVNLAYYMYVNHDVMPSEFHKMGHGERIVLRAFMMQEIKDRKEANKNE